MQDVTYTLTWRSHFLLAVMVLSKVIAIPPSDEAITPTIPEIPGSVSTETAVVDLTESLIETHFVGCTVFFAQDGLESGSSQDVFLSTLILRSPAEMTKYVVKFHNGTAPSSDDEQAWTYRKLSSIHKYRSNCLLTVPLISSVSSSFVAQLESLVAPTFMPFSRNDRDYYMFIANPAYHPALLQMEELSTKIKYKIAMGVNSDSGKIEATSVDIFGGPRGSPKLISLPMDNILEKRAVFPDFLKNLRGHTIRISIPLAIAMLEAHRTSDINNGKRGRWTYLFDEYLTVKFNFTYHMFVSAGGGGSGLLLRNGTWIGVVGDLYYRRADFGLAVANTDARLLCIGFTDTYFHAGCLTFVTGHPTEIFSSMALFWPFEITVWMGILAAALFSLGFVSLITKTLDNMKSERRHVSFAGQVLRLLAPVLEQDITAEPSSTPLRCFLALWLFYCLIITTLYRSKLVTILAFPLLGQVPKTFEQLAFSDFGVGFSKNGDSAYNTFKKSQDPVYVSLLQRMELYKGVNLSCLQEVVNTDRTSCIAYDFDVVYLRQRNFSNAEARKLVPSGASTYNIWMGLATQPNSLFSESFGKVLGQTLCFHLGEIWDRIDMHENVQKPKLDWWAATNQTAEKLLHGDDEGDDGLTLNNIMSVFYALFYFLLGSTIAFLYEYRKGTFVKSFIIVRKDLSDS